MMPGLIRNLRARSFDAFCWVAMPLAVAGLASVGLETVSFGHEHLDGGHALHHRHFFLGPHEHPHDDHESDRDHDDHDHDSDHDHGAPDPQDRPAHQRTATVSAAPALFQPVPVCMLAVAPADSTLLVLPPAPPSPARFVLQPSPPRGPPLSIAVPGL